VINLKETSSKMQQTEKKLILAHIEIIKYDNDFATDCRPDSHLQYSSTLHYQTHSGTKYQAVGAGLWRFISGHFDGGLARRKHCRRGTAASQIK
jgi:hypothetical protein